MQALFNTKIIHNILQLAVCNRELKVCVSIEHVFLANGANGREVLTEESAFLGTNTVSPRPRLFAFLENTGCE